MAMTPAQAPAMTVVDPSSSGRSRPERHWIAALFALPFAGGGVAMLVFLLLPILVDGWRAQAWHQGEARLTSAGLDVGHGDDSTTYKARATYTYEYRGREYHGERVAISSGSDNIGDFQQTLARELQQAYASNRLVPVWVNPDDPREALLNRDLRWGVIGLYSAVVLLFGGFGFGLLWFALRPRAGATAPAGAASKPWLIRPQWANPVNSNAAFGAGFAWVFAVLWNLIAIPVGAMTAQEVLGGNKAAAFGLLFPLVGVGLLAWALKQTAALRRFGRTALIMDPWPGAIGGQVGGTVDVRLPYEPNLAFRTSLTCLYSRMTGSGKRRRRTESVVWQSEGFAHARPELEATRLEILFDVDAGLPASDLQEDNEYHLWRLQVEAELPGVDFHRSFEIPVFPTGERAARLSRLSSEHRQAAERRAQAIEEVLDIRHISGGVELYYPAFRQPAAKLVALIFGAAFLAFGVLTGKLDPPVLLRAVFGAVGGGIVLLALYSLAVSLRVRMDHARLETRKRLLGVPAGGQVVPRQEIRCLSMKQSYSTSSGRKHTLYFDLQALTRAGRSVTIGHNLEGRETARQALESLSRLTGIPVAETQQENLLA